MPVIKYYNNFYNVTVQNTRLQANCAEVAIVNIGTATVTINGALPLLTGESISFDGKKGEMDTTVYTFLFGSGVMNAVFIRKYYNDPESELFTIHSDTQTFRL
jgi:hypothetical protein